MPQIKQVNLDNGIFIETVGNLPNINLLTAQFPSVSNAEQLSGALTSTCQRTVEITKRLSDFPREDPVRQRPPILAPNERIAGGNLIITELYIAVHVFNYPVQSRSDFTVMTSDFPIGGDWWL
jgi:hypothetical protein